jgi:Reverse transcriptase (RNA-dependent DNA polymerase)
VSVSSRIKNPPEARNTSESETPRRDRWERVVEVVQSAFTRTAVPQVFGIGILVLIPKSEHNQFRGIALLDVIYKLISRITSTRMNDSISYHDAVHGFRRKRGTTTAISELKLYMRATRMNEKIKPRFIIFLDLKKAYDTLDRLRTLEILRAYGVGPNICHFIEQTWEMDQMIPKQAGCFGTAFTTSRGVRQGDIMSPTVFNIVVDAIINYSDAQDF